MLSTLLASQRLHGLQHTVCRCSWTFISRRNYPNFNIEFCCFLSVLYRECRGFLRISSEWRQIGAKYGPDFPEIVTRTAKSSMVIGTFSDRWWIRWSHICGWNLTPNWRLSDDKHVLDCCGWKNIVDMTDDFKIYKIWADASNTGPHKAFPCGNFISMYT